MLEYLFEGVMGLTLIAWGICVIRVVWCVFQKKKPKVIEKVEKPEKPPLPQKDPMEFIKSDSSEDWTRPDYCLNCKASIDIMPHIDGWCQNCGELQDFDVECRRTERQIWFGGRWTTQRKYAATPHNTAVLVGGDGLEYIYCPDKVKKDVENAKDDTKVITKKDNPS